MKIFIETERLIIRELMPSDDIGMFELDSDPEVVKYLCIEPLQDIGQSRKIIAMIRQQYIDNGIGRWAVIEKTTNNFLGWAGLKLITTPVNNHVNIYDLGYRLIKKYWEHGYATEAAIAAKNYGFDQLELSEIYATAHVDNLSSENVLKKTGFKLIEAFVDKGRPTNWFKITTNRK